MLIERQPMAIKSLSVRTDIAAYEAIHALAKAVKTSPSVLLRLALVDLLTRAKMEKATNLKELMSRAT
jgi:predicted transcriptional regulator